jgi:predicted transcriptional regulator
MTPRRRKDTATNAELRILQVLWREGPATVGRVHELVIRDHPAAYTTTLKLMQIMLEKGLVTRDTSSRTHVYTAAVSESGMQRAATADLLDRLFGGSAAALMQQALAAEPASREELRRIRELLDAAERREEESDD